MNRRTIVIICIIAITVIWYVAVNNKPARTEEIDNATFQQDEMSKRSPRYFEKYAREDMSYQEMIAVFGEPDAEVGSGINIYEYKLLDGSSVYIGFSNPSQVSYVFRDDNNGNREYILNT